MSLFSRWLVPVLVAAAAAIALVLWANWQPGDELVARVPGTDHSPAGEGGRGGSAVLSGQVVTGPGQPAALGGSWPQFRGATRDGISTETTSLARGWPATGPREIWGVDVGEGYGGPAIQDGRVYLMDYDRDKRQGALRCLSLADGREIWRYAYPLAIKRNHGMTRTVPAVAGDAVVAIDPKCNVLCVDSKTGALRWGLSLVSTYGATVPPWYTGQCPLVDGDRVILAPGSAEALFAAVELATGKPIWKTPNPRGWKMTHASVMPMTIGERRTFVYCGSGGVAAVDAANGALLWETTDWKISIATVPSPLVMPDGRIFLSGGYNAGSAMLQVTEAGGKFSVRTLFRLTADTFGATQHSPVCVDGHIYGIKPNGQFACLDGNGKSVWTSGAAAQFGLGPFLATPAVVFGLNENGTLSLFETSATKFNLLARSQVLKGRECWGPMALAGGRLLVRDLTRLVCLDVAAPSS